MSEAKLTKDQHRALDRLSLTTWRSAALVGANPVVLKTLCEMGLADYELQTNLSGRTQLVYRRVAS